MKICTRLTDFCLSIEKYFAICDGGGLCCCDVCLCNTGSPRLLSGTQSTCGSIMRQKKRRLLVIVLLAICGCLIIHLHLYNREKIPVYQLRNKEKLLLTKEAYRNSEPSIQDKRPKKERDRTYTKYIEFKKTDILAGDLQCNEIDGCQLSPPTSPEQAKRLCDKNPRCKGFVYASWSNDIYFKSDVSNELKEKSDVTSFIKRDNVRGLKIPQTTCAVSLNKTVLTDVSQGCNMAEFDPFSPSIMQLIHVPDKLKCPGIQHTVYRNNTLKLINKDPNISKAEYFSITRKPGSDSEFIQGTPTSFDHEKQNKVTDEFIGVKIRSRDGQESAEFHGAVAPKPDVIARTRSTTGIPVNVMIVGIDSMSNAHFQRSQQKAYKYLTEDLKSIVFKGYTIVGDGTTPALTAMLTGYFEKELPEARRGFQGTQPVDKWPWIFKDFKRSGYATLFSEDDPFFGSFNYRLHGFKDPPTDHFGRYFWLAARATSWNCIHSKPQHLVHLDYLESFFEAYLKTPKFGLGFFSSVAHNNLNSVYTMADDFYNFLKNIETRLNDTILIVLGDHGFRYGKSRSTLQGHLEERLPFLSFTLPSWFQSQYPDIINNLRHNVNAVTSPFDLHMTLRHVLSYPLVPKPPEGSRGSTLFEKIPQSRDCESAGVKEHYCPCLSLETADTEHSHIQLGSLAIVDYINKMLSEDRFGIGLCHQLKLHQIVSSHQQMPNSKFQRFKGSADVHGRVPKFSDKRSVDDECNYQIQIRTVPGGGLFEAPVRFKEGKFTLTGDISRINKYGDQPRCILDHNRDLRKYCVCKNV